MLNLIGPAKAAQVELPLIGAVTFGAGVLFFPISYVFGDILTEVYGYSRARRVIWSGFAALLFAAVMAAVVVALPPAPNWPNQTVYEIAFGNTWRIALASMFAYFCGEFVNSFVLAKMKVWTDGRYQGARFVGSTVAGEAVELGAVLSAGVLQLRHHAQRARDHAGLQPVHHQDLVEIAFLPLTYRIVAWLKRAENEDYFDRNTNFNPFKVEA